ncbi:MAG: chaperone NapD [Rubrivivax sp.]|nr:chaperone NapD [Rubrivivax sp.]
MNISSLVVHVKAEEVRRVQGALGAIAGVEVHAATEAGHFVVTVDAPDDDAALAIHRQISELPGVMSAALVYHHAEPEPEPDSASETEA